MFPSAERRSTRAAWFLKLAAGILIFWLAFRDLDPSAVVGALGLLDPAWLAAAVASVFLTLALVVARWSTLLGAEPRHTIVLLSAVIASQVSNIVMPFRLGDALRIGAVSRTLAVPPAEVLGSVAVERLLDGLFAALTAGLLVAAGSLPPFARGGMLTLALAVGLALAVLAAGVRFRRLLRFGRAEGQPRGGSRVGGWLSAQVEHLVRGLRRASEPRVAGPALLWSAGVMAGSVLTAWLVLQAFQLDAPAASAVVIVIAVQVGTVVIPIPGGIGVSQVLTVQALQLWDVPEAPALAYALMLYLVARLPKIAVLPFALSALAAKPGAAN